MMPGLEVFEKGLEARALADALAVLVAGMLTGGKPITTGRKGESPPWILADSSTASKTLKSEIIMIFSKISMDLDIFL